MKLIGVYGGSGAGKSTTSKLLNQLIDNSVIIPLDPFMHQYIGEHTDTLCQKLGINERPKHFLTYMAQKTGSNKFWVDEIKEDIEKDTWDIIDCYPDEDYIILDWAFLAYSNLFNECDYTILVKGEEELKYRRLRARLEKDGQSNRWGEQELRVRIQNSEIDCQGPTPDYTLFNDGKHSLCDQLVDIATSITNKDDISRKKTTL